MLIRLVLASRNKVALNDVADKCRKLGVEVAVVITDVSKPLDCK